ncbi:nipped-B-like protein A, partial [Salminus brasiliensis]|uniref:nipped-B-like protein A n=1 Tax=Salminus brasiliensis TaxID=930266 RepID=UPI003B82DA50
MNGDMPHVPITTLAGIAGLTDLLNQLPLPSPLPGTTTKSLLYSVRVVEEVDRLLACRDDALAAQLAGGLAQVSTDQIELKDSLSTDELEGDVPVLLQLLLSRNPSLFRAKTSPTTPQYSAQTGLAQPQMAPPFKMTHNAMQGSPASANYQQGSMTHSPSGRFVAGQAGSGGRFLSQQTSPVPSPYTPQSPVTAYRQYPHPPAYSQPQHLQQGPVASPMIPGSMRNPLDSK